MRELDATSGNIGDSSTLASLSRGDETYRFSVRDYSSGQLNQTELAYCKSANTVSNNDDRVCVDCVQPDGTAYAGARLSPRHQCLL